MPSDFLWMMGLYAGLHGDAQFVYAFASDFHCNPWDSINRGVRNRWFHAAAYAVGLRSADVIAIQHDHQSQLVSQSLQNRLIHVPNLVRCISSYPRSYAATRFDAIWIGRIRPQKQVEHFLDLAAAALDCNFAVVGGFGEDLSPSLLDALAERMQSLSNLIYFGPQRASEVLHLLKLSKVLVNTSPAEGFPNAMLEAWGVGVPVLSLFVDPGGVIKRERIGLVSGSNSSLLRDLCTLTSEESLNLEFGSRGPF
jgi:glycosyltransferase involved in cell wall biosynthesis